MKKQKLNFLEGKKIILRPLSVKDVSETYLSWLNDPEVNRYNSHAIFPYSIEQLERYVKGIDNTSKVVLAICDKKSHRHIGNAALQGIDWITRSAEFAILIGEKQYWRKGIGEEAGRLLVDYGFTCLNIHRIHCGTSSQNVGMQKLAIKLGMRKEGRRRDAVFKHGRWDDVIEYGILDVELKKRSTV